MYEVIPQQLVGAERRCEMIRQNNDDLVVQVHNAFWPAFFTSELAIRMIGQCVAMCLINRSLKQQLIVLYPEQGFSTLPEMKELLKVFPYNDAVKTKRHLDPEQLPISIADLRDIKGVQIDTVQLVDRTVFLLTPLWCSDEETLQYADSTLTSAFIDTDMTSLDLCSANHLILHAENGRQCKVLALVRNNACIKFTPEIEFFSSSDGLVQPVASMLQPPRDDD